MDCWVRDTIYAKYDTTAQLLGNNNPDEWKHKEYAIIFREDFSLSLITTLQEFKLEWRIK